MFIIIEKTRICLISDKKSVLINSVFTPLVIMFVLKRQYDNNFYNLLTFSKKINKENNT
ncbi:hypothetical protein AtNW77_Chr2g0250231 [Arabidopsis thaliana]